MPEVSTVTAATVHLKLQQGATQPKPAFRYVQRDGTYLDLTTVSAVHVWFRNKAGVIVSKNSIGDGLTIGVADDTGKPELLIISRDFKQPVGCSYTYDVKIFLTENDYFFPQRGNAMIVGYTSE